MSVVIFVHKALRKEAEAYRAQAPHVVAARKRGDVPAGEVRSVIDYVITVAGPEPAGRPREGATDFLCVFEDFLAISKEYLIELLSIIIGFQEYNCETKMHFQKIKENLL